MAGDINSSQFSMWRALVALVFADGQKHADEVDFFKDYFSKLALSDQQRDVLMADLNSPQNVDELFKSISVPRDRSQFIYFARLLFWSDGDFDHQEQEIHKRLTEEVMGKVDLEKAMHEVDKVTAEFMAKSKAYKEGLGWRHKMVDALVFWEDLS